MTKMKNNKSQLLKNKKSEIDNNLLWVTVLQRQATVHNNTVNADTWYKELTSTAQCFGRRILCALIVIIEDVVKVKLSFCWTMTVFPCFALQPQ